MNMIKARKFTYILSAVLVTASILSIVFFGLRLGIDFTGGSILEMEYKNARPEIGEIQKALGALNLGEIRIQPTGERGALIRLREISEEEHQIILSELSGLGEVEELRFDSIGPVIGQELQRRSVWAAFFVLLMIILYIAWAFRGVSKPVSSWFYGAAAIVALFHDILIPMGVFSVLGKFYGVEIDTLFVTAILTVLGFSVHDTIVVFDRVRENLKGRGQPQVFEEVVGKSLSETFKRSIFTSFAILLVLISIFLFGSESTRYFSLTLLVGTVAGTYSSLFLATPLLVTWNSWRSQ